MIGLAGVEVPEGYTDLGTHAPANEQGICPLCGVEIETGTYEEYTAWWYANEWEGERHHTPWDETLWTYIRTSCLANDPGDPNSPVGQARIEEDAQAEAEADFIRRNGTGVL